MRTNWKEIPKDGVKGQWAAMNVTLNPKGEIALSRRTWERMGEPKAFVVLFDATNNRIGLKPAHESTRNAYKCARRGTRGAKLLRVYRMMVECRIDLPQTMEFVNPDRDDEGILLLDLRTARACRRGRRGMRDEGGRRRDEG